VKLYLVRHGDSSLSARTDNERELSEKGELEVQQIANLILPLDLPISTIWHSEKRRAEQTANILSGTFPKATLQCTSDLAPMASLNPILDKIYTSPDDLLLVGHMPFMGRLVSKLIVGEEDENIVNFGTGCIVCLERVVTHYWAINWMLRPNI